ncbi:hypothetical protein KIN20_024000 [Parelaphostrongylus tenuis]|uniref:C2H2-type domain-containing protein n=1 Tax=Parelaphostrongylus tenuis TaxID=148309 RepID=A0AAD5QTB8_PARTN|nr:hypothetical protein KIN20_024000 [Parelaphostrongylus tenuis]
MKTRPRQSKQVTGLSNGSGYRSRENFRSNMGGSVVPTISGAVLQNSYSYVQINIYDTNIKELQDRGVDIKHMLEHIGVRSVVMDVPILPSPPADISVENNVRRLKSFGGFHLHSRPTQQNNPADATSRLDKSAEKVGDMDMMPIENEIFHHGDYDGNNTTLAASLNNSNTSEVNREAPLTSTPLRSKRKTSFGRYMRSSHNTTPKSPDQNSRGNAPSCQKGKKIDEKLADQPLQHEQSRSTGKDDSNFNSDTMLPTRSITSVNNVTVFQDCQDVFVDVPLVDECIDVHMSSQPSSSSPEAATFPLVQASPKTQLSPITYDEAEPVEDIGGFGDITITQHSFTSFTREVVSAMQSINPTSLIPLRDMEPSERFSPEGQKPQQSISFGGADKMQLKHRIFENEVMNEESDYSAEIGSQSYIAAKEGVADDISGNQILPLSSLTLENHESNQPLNATPLFRSKSDSLQNPDPENVQSTTAGRSVNKKRARTMLKDSVKNESAGSTMKPIVRHQVFCCCMPGCGKRISWRPRYGKNRLVDHVRVHWAKEVKRCKLCDFKASNCRKINHHHRNAHSDSPYMGALSIETREDLDELIALWRQCFPGLPTSGTVKWIVSSTNTTGQ